MTYFAGIDVGAATTKAVLLKDGAVVTYHLVPSGGSYREAARSVLEEVLGKASISTGDLAAMAATGYGASNAPNASIQINEILCQARGTWHLFPTARTVIDIGGQATRVIKVNQEGQATDFVISEKCAAGSGRFLQIIARVLRVPLEHIGPLSLNAKENVKFTTSCAVFAESEAVSRVAEGARKEDILAGVHASMAAKVGSLVQRVRLEPDVVLTGGGAKDIGLVRSIEAELGLSLLIPEEPQLTGALGAALLAKEGAA